jgi:hypothetical protein
MVVAFLAFVALRADASDDATHDLTQAWAEQQRCWDAWDHLIADWKQHNGGIGKSLLATRRQISEDRTSKFAAIVRATWATQKTPVPSDQFGQWPVSDSRYRDVFHGVADAAKPYIHEEVCRGAYWLDDVLWDELRGVHGDPAKGRAIEEMPADVNAQDAHSASGWVAYWLFVRIGT